MSLINFDNNSIIRDYDFATEFINSNFENYNDPFEVPQPILYESTIFPEIPTFEAYEKDDSIMVELRETDDYRSIKSLGNFSIPTYEKVKFRHEFIYDMISAGTDIKLHKVFGPLDTGDNYSPDFIFARQGDDYNKVCVIEYAAANNDSLVHLQRVFNTKRISYENDLRKRSSDSVRVKLFVIITTERNVFTNCEISQDMVEELCFRFRVAEAIRFKLVNQGVMQAEMDEEYSEDHRNFIESINKWEINWEAINKSKFINKKKYDMWMEELGDDDIEYVVTQFNEGCKSEAKKIREEFQPDKPYGERMKKIMNDFSESKKNLFEKMLTMGIEFKSETNMKSVIPFPMIIPERTEPTLDYRFSPRPVVTGSTVTERLWAEVFQEALLGNIKITRNSEEINIENLDVETDEFNMRTNKKSETNRVKVSLDLEDRIELALIGVQGKAYKENSRVIEREKERRKGFKPTQKTSDIDEYMNDFGKMLEKHNSQSLTNNKIRDLNKNAYNLHVDNTMANESLEFFDYFADSRLGAWSNFISDIGTELAISLKQNTRKDHFILKKLMNWDCYLLIKTTNISSHIFYSIFIPKNRETFKWETTVCGDFNERDEYIYTEFRSFNADKLVNVSKFEATAYSLLAYWLEFVKVGTKNISSVKDKFPLRWKEVYKMLALSILMDLHDKLTVDAISSLLRYIDLEGYVIWPCFPKPHKIMSKLPAILRSRLEVWFFNKLLNHMEYIILCGGFIELRGDKGTSFKNIKNPYTGYELSGPDQVINLYYLGYLKNKDESGDAHSTFKMLEKIAKIENETPDFGDLGFKNPNVLDIKVHEYSPSYIKYAAFITKKRMEANFGASVHERIFSTFTKNINKTSMINFATLKASCSFDGSDDFRKKHPEYHRKKCIEACVEFCKSHNVHKLSDALPIAMEELMRRGEVWSDLFKKPQHNSLREIYVVDFVTKIVQYCAEELARTVNNFIAGDTISHPKNKTKLIQRMGVKTKKLFSDSGIIVNTSDDCKQWHQGFTTPVLAQALCSMTDKRLHKMVLCITHIWEKKKVLIPDEIYEQFSKKSDFKSYDPIIQEAYDGFKGKKEVHWAGADKPYWEIWFSFFQGILHSWSSLIHIMHLEAVSELQLKYMNDSYSNFLKKNEGKEFKTFEEFEEDNTYTDKKKFIKKNDKVFLDKNNIERLINKKRFTENHQSGSDDSAQQFGTDVNSLEEFSWFCQLASVMFRMKQLFGKLASFWPSEKSTTMTLGFIEYNSEYFFLNSLYKPTFRWVAAICSISEHESLGSRQEELKGLITSIIEGGGSINLASKCQEAQSLLFYRLFGSSVSLYFSSYVDLLSSLSDPGLGYFLLDHPLAAGIFDFKYNLWNCMNQTNLGKRYMSVVNWINNQAELPEGEQTRKQKTFETTSAGNLYQNYFVIWGNRDKLQKLRDRLELPENWKEKIKEEPYQLYRKPISLDELLINVCIKLRSPGVSEALSKGSHLTRIIASSVYILNKSILRNMNEFDMEGKISGISLYRLALKIKKNDEETAVDLNQDVLNRLFPYYSEYESIKNNLEVFRNYEVQINHRNKKVTTEITVYEDEGINVFRAEDLCVQKWFKIKRVHAASRVYEQAWMQLKATFPWIKETHDETLKLSPFDTPEQLCNFLSRLDRKGRKVRISGVPIKDKAKINYITAICQNFSNGFQLVPKENIKIKETTTDYLTANHVIKKILQFPYNSETKLKRLEEFFETIDIKYNYNATKSRKNQISILNKFIKGESSEEITKLIYHNQIGIIGAYERRQKYNEGKYTGEGLWVGQMDDVKVKILIDSDEQGSYFKRIHVNSNSFNSHDLLRSLRQFSTDHNIANREVSIKLLNETETDYNKVHLRHHVNFIAGVLDLKYSNSLGACQIIYDPEIQFTYSPDDAPDLYFGFKNHTINILGKKIEKVKRTERIWDKKLRRKVTIVKEDEYEKFLTIMSITFREGESMEMSFKVSEENTLSKYALLKQWVEDKPDGNVLNVIKKLINGEIPNTEISVANHFIKGNIEACLKLVGCYKMENLTNVNEADDTDAGFKNIADIEFGFDDFGGFEDTTLQEDFIMPDAEADEYENKEFSEDVMTALRGIMEENFIIDQVVDKGSFEFYSTKYFMEALNIMSREGLHGGAIRTLLERNRCNERFKENATLLFRMLGKDPSKINFYSTEIKKETFPELDPSEGF